MAIFQINQRRGHKFVMFAAMFGFCMSRILTCVLRIVWATQPANARLIIAAQILTNAGVLIVYIVASLLVQRVLRAKKPELGWNQPLRLFLRMLYVLLGAALVLVIVFTILLFYSLDSHILSATPWIQRGAITYLLVFNIITLAGLCLAVLLPRSPNREDFGTGSMRSKEIIVTVLAFFCILIAGFRAGTNWEAPRQVSNPTWYDSRAPFYVFSFSLEIIIIYLLLLTRFDKRFWIPNGSSSRRRYSHMISLEHDEAVKHEYS